MKQSRGRFLLILFLGLTACQTNSASRGELEIDLNNTEQAQLVDALMETAIFETSVVKQLTAQAPTKTSTPPPATETPQPTMTPTLQPTVARNPWLLQSACEPFDNSICVRYSVYSSSETYSTGQDVQVRLTHAVSGESGFFVIGPGVTGTITLVKGTYQAIYTAKCEGEWVSLSKTWAINNRTDKFGCQGKQLKYFGVKVGP